VVNGIRVVRLELRDAAEVVDFIRGGSVFAFWAPGDATLYRVTMIKAVEFGLNAMTDEADMHALLVVVGDAGYRQHLLVPAPAGDRRWTVQSFVRAFGVDYAGWWAGVRPLLAALGWTPSDQRELDYDPNDAVAAAVVLNHM
jgi:hypothetical protein